MSATATVDELFKEVSGRLLAENPDVQQGRMMNAVGLKTGGKFFAMVVKGELVVKLPAERVNELEETGAGKRFDPGHGRLMKEWISLRPLDEFTCAAHLNEARTFVSAQAKG